MRKHFQVLLILSVLLVLLASCATTDKSTKTDPTVISVSGNGVVYLEADMVKFSIDVSETADTTGEAQQKTNKKMAQILDLLKKHKVDDNDISTTALNFSTEYNWDNGKQIKVGEYVSQTVYVTMKDINEFSPLADDIGSKISGISFYNVNFDSTQKIVAGNTARELAYKNAYEKAQLYAKQAGLEVSRPLSINEGYTSYATANYKRAYAEDSMVMMATEGAAPAYATQTPTGLLSASVDVSITFELR
ncbi:MAG: SIMPL domain-containing protein [Spirochaetales bacterium]|nr:SIMPL domain-containing protein [Spirochaetales bacterium]